MAAPAQVIEDLLAPISDEHPAGEDITLAPEWQAINQARRRDKLLGRQNCDWPALQNLLRDALAHKSKDLRLAIWLLEANVQLHGFVGLRDSSRLLRELIVTYWDSGLYPEVEAGDLQFRSMPLEWLGSDFPRLVRQVPLTVRTDGGRDYSFLDYRRSLEIGSEKDLRNSLGDIDPDKEAKRKADLAAGGISAEMFEAAVKATRRAGMEVLHSDVESAWAEFQALDQALDEKFGADAPGTSEAKDAIEECRRLVDELLKRKRQEEPDAVESQTKSADENGQNPGHISLWTDSFGSSEADGGSWFQAEELVRQGKVQEGLGEMTRLSSQQHGRVHFQHRLRLAEICLSINRERLAIAILEELAKSIDELHLEKWESPELLGRVWGRLYKCYRGAEAGSEQAARANALFDRLCRIDPWQALRWED